MLIRISGTVAVPCVNDNCVTLDINQQSARDGALSLLMTDARDDHSIWLIAEEVQ